MCFASSVVESHKKLFIANAGGGGAATDKRDSLSGTSAAAAAAKAFKIDKKILGTTNSLKTNKMSRAKTRIQTEVCGDCGAADPSWASINRGILLCSDCCSVHRSLGRHISIVKSLRQGTWEPSVLNFVNSLNAHGANSVWEHHLLDASSSGSKSSGRLRKPSPKDLLHPNKSDFIKAKHVQLSFVLKPNLQDAEDDISAGGFANLENELSKQLHASVRTSNLETSLRLLVQGADPNFFHEEKHSTPLHVAAKFGQASQIELLIVHGANINAIDGNGLTPLEVAKANNHTLIAERLLDAMYEVTDRIIMYLGGKKPDHTTGRHLIIPDTNAGEISEQLKIARGRLQLVPNKMFEELVMDLYDEVDRRENEAIWSTSTLNGENVAVPFLPANPFLSATRNQGRQKLARFVRAEFNGLLTDVLIDARRRQNMANLRPLDGPAPPTSSQQQHHSLSAATATSMVSSSVPNSNQLSSYYNSNNDYHDPNLSDDEPIYDPVADDDYEPMPPIAQQAIVHQSARNDETAPPMRNNYEMETLRKQISEYVSEINQLKTVVHKLSTENSELKTKFSNVKTHQQQTNSNSNSNTSVYDEPLRIDCPSSENEPHSLPEAINSNLLRANSQDSGQQQHQQNNSSNSTSTSSSTTNSQQSTIKRPASMYERRLQTNMAAGIKPDSRNTTSMYQMAADNKSFSEEVNQKVDIVTHRLKELIHSMQDPNNRDALVPCADRIRAAVLELINVFTAPINCNETLRETLKQLTRNNILIQHNCENLRNSFDSDDKAAIAKYTKDVRECAYYIASATKTIVLQLD